MRVRRTESLERLSKWGPSESERLASETSEILNWIRQGGYRFECLTLKTSKPSSTTVKLLWVFSLFSNLLRSNIFFLIGLLKMHWWILTALKINHLRPQMTACPCQVRKFWQSQSEISVTAQSSISNRSGAEKRKATEVSGQDVKKTKLSVETRSHFEAHRTKANRVVCKHCKFDYYVATDSLAHAFRPRCALNHGCKYLRFCWSDIVLFFQCYNSLIKFDRLAATY